MQEKKREPHWFLLVAVTAITEGIVQVLTTHFDSVATWVRFGLTGLSAEIVAHASPVFLTVAIIALVLGLLRKAPPPSPHVQEKRAIDDMGPIERLL